MSVARAPSLRSCRSASSVPSTGDRSCRKVTAGASSCWFDCGENDVKNLTNIASGDYPKWVCHPCASARRALDKQGREAKNKDIMADLRKNQEKYKAMVRQSRITPDPMISDKTQFQQRQFVLSNMFSCEAASRTAVQCLNDVLWLNKKQYIAHQMYTNGETMEQAVSILMFTMMFLYTYYNKMCDINMYVCNILTHSYIVFI
jgi:glutaredoxin